MNDRKPHVVIVGGGFGGLAAAKALKNAPVREVIVSNTLPISDDKQFDSLRVMSIAPLLAGAIDAIFCDGSVSGLFGGDNL